MWIMSADSERDSAADSMAFKVAFTASSGDAVGSLVQASKKQLRTAIGVHCRLLNLCEIGIGLAGGC